MKGDRNKLRLRLMRFVKHLDMLHDEMGKVEFQNGKIMLDYNEACAALAALNILNEEKVKLKVK